MPEIQPGEYPEVAFKVELNSSLSHLHDSNSPLQQSLSNEILQRLTDLLETLGIPGRPSVRISACAVDSLFQPVRVFVNGLICRYPRELLWQVYSYAREVPVNHASPQDEINAWLRNPSEPDPSAPEAHYRKVIEFISTICLEAVKVRPAVLLGKEQATVYLTLLPDLGDANEEPEGSAVEHLIPVLHNVLNQRISIADKLTVGKIIQEGLLQARSTCGLSEDLIASLRPDIVQILISPDYLKEITLLDNGNGRERFSWVGRDLFEDLGQTYPGLEFLPASNFQHGMFAFKINHLVTAPYIGLKPDQALVMNTPSELQERNIQGLSALHPAKDDLCSIIDLRTLEGGTTIEGLNQMEYVASCLMRELKWNAVCFLDHKFTSHQLSQLEQLFPTLVKMVRSALTTEELTVVLRSLIAEGISLRYLRLMLERFLDYHYQVLDPIKYFVSDLNDGLTTHTEAGDADTETFTGLVSFIRSGLKSYITSRFTDQEGKLHAYIVDPETEHLLWERQKLSDGELGDGELSQAETENFLESIRYKLISTPVSGVRPVILTSVETRPLLREVLIHEFPLLPVLAYNEVSHNLNINIIEKISIPGG